MVPDVAFEVSVSSAAADVAAHGGRPRSCGFDVKTCGHVGHLYSLRAGRGVLMQRRAESVRMEWTRKVAEAAWVRVMFPWGPTGPSSGPGLSSRG